MIQITLLGTGNVATHLFKVFHTSDNVKINQVYNHKEASLSPFKNLVKTTTNLGELEESDIFIVALKDDFMEETIKKIAKPTRLIAHSSGSLPLLQENCRNAVFYPLQTFSKNTAVDFTEIPLCLETEFEKDYAILENLAKSISKKVFSISTSQRKSLHLSAVFVCNFVNHLYSIGEDLCKENQVPYPILTSLITETAQKATKNSPAQVQTGPAIRNDRETINRHLSQLSSANFKEIYTLLTQSIQDKHGKKL